jgi:hypothetical protein
MGKYYCYRHIRADKNEPFYIGIGLKRINRNIKSVSTEYERAFSKCSRNNIWKSVVNKTDYNVEIIFESDSEEDIKNKETEFIKLYGLIYNKTGCLANYIVQATYNSGYIRNNLKNSDGVYQYDLEGNFIKKWYSVSEIVTALSFDSSSLLKCIRKQSKTYKNYMWFKENQGLKIESYDKNKYREKLCRVIYRETNQEIIYKSMSEAAKKENINLSTLRKYINTNKFKNNKLFYA